MLNTKVRRLPSKAHMLDVHIRMRQPQPARQAPAGNSPEICQYHWL